MRAELACIVLAFGFLEAVSSKIYDLPQSYIAKTWEGSTGELSRLSYLNGAASNVLLKYLQNKKQNGRNKTLMNKENKRRAYKQFSKRFWFFSYRPSSLKPETKDTLNEDDTPDLPWSTGYNLWRMRERRKPPAKRQSYYCDTTRITLQMILEYLTSGRICGMRVAAVRFGLGRRRRR